MEHPLKQECNTTFASQSLVCRSVRTACTIFQGEREKERDGERVVNVYFFVCQAY